MSCGCNSGSSSGYDSGYNDFCNADTPYPSISHESVPSLIDNLVSALYGAITKDASSGKVVWNLPCNPASYAPIFGVSPYTDQFGNITEGMLCYIMRALSMANTLTGIVYTGAVQTLTNKTLTSTTINTATINTATINNLTATGTLSLPTGSITSLMILNNTIVPSDLSIGGPSWDTLGNTTIGGSITATGNISTAGELISSAASANGNGVVELFSRDATNAALGHLQVNSTKTGAIINQVDALPIQFLTNNTARAIITSNGKVGIGTTSPSQTLDVNGIGSFQGVQIGNCLTGYYGDPVNLALRANGTGISGNTTGSIYFQGNGNTTPYAIVSVNGLDMQAKPVINCSNACIAKFYTTSNPTTPVSVNIANAFNVTSVTRGSTAGLYNIVITGGNGTWNAIATPISGVTNAGIRIVSATSAGITIQAYVGVTATDMQFSFVMF